MIYKSITELIGKTPLVELINYNKVNGLTAKIAAKVEFFNPTGSVKDRAAYSMICDAENHGLLKKGGVIIEPTSGNTGIGLAAVAATKGYRAIFVMPETMTIERRMLLTAYGAEVVLTEGSLGMAGAIKKAEELCRITPDAFMPSQFENPSNPAIHLRTTGPEIWQDTEGKVDILVCGVGTGGTVSGAGEYLKSQNPQIKVVAVEPSDSPVLSGGKKGAHGIQGLGAGFIPNTLNTAIFNEIITVSTSNAIQAARQLAKSDGLLTGISSGAALHAATQIALRPENNGKLIVVVLPDTGERYLTSKLFE